jgi:hypothetical protein
MGTRGTGPFDNDMAGDYGSRLDRTEPDAREALLRRALARSATSTIQDWEEAVAAAAVIAAQCPGGEPLHPVYGPQTSVPPLLVDLRHLATAALVVVYNSPSLAESWVREQLRDKWRTNLAQLHEVLTTASARPPQPPHEYLTVRPRQAPAIPPGPPAAGPRRR